MTPEKLENLQRSLMGYIEGGNEDIRQHIVDDGKIDINTRLGIYHNAYRLRLRETLDTDHGVLGIYLGDDLFDRMVKEYIIQYPSIYTSLRNFADSLPEFLLNNSPFSDFPILAELSRFERILLVAFDAAESIGFTHEHLQKIPQDEWPAMKLFFHPSFQIFTSEWNSVDIWQALKANEVPPEPISAPGTWWVWRNRDRLTEFRSVDDEEAVLATLVLQGESLESLCDYLLTTYDEQLTPQQIIHYLLKWINEGLLIMPPKLLG